MEVKVFAPFSRGEQSWEQYLKRVEYLGILHDDEMPFAKGAVQLSDLFVQKIAGPAALSRVFKKRFLSDRQAVSMNLADILKDVNVNDPLSITPLKSEFYFCYSLAIDKYFTHQEQLLFYLDKDNINADQADAQVICRLYKDKDDRKALHMFEKLIGNFPHSYYIHFKLGLIYLCSSTVLNLNRAFVHFKKAASLAEQKKDAEFSSCAYLHCAFVAYLQLLDTECLRYTEAAVSLDAENWGAVLLRAKIAALENDEETTKLSLQKIVKADRNYLIKIDADNDFEFMRTEFYNELYQMKKASIVNDYLSIDKSHKNVLDLEELVVKEAAMKTRFQKIVFDEYLQEKLAVFKKDKARITAIYNENTFFSFEDFSQESQAFFKLWGKDKNVWLRLLLKNIMNDLLKIRNSKKHVENSRKRFTVQKQFRIFLFSLLGVAQIVFYFGMLLFYEHEQTSGFWIGIVAVLVWSAVCLFHISNQKSEAAAVDRIKEFWRALFLPAPIDHQDKTDENKSTKPFRKRLSAQLVKMNHTKLRVNFVSSFVFLLLTLILLALLGGTLLKYWRFISIACAAATLSAIINETIRLVKNNYRYRRQLDKLERRIEDVLAKRRN